MITSPLTIQLANIVYFDNMEKFFFLKIPFDGCATDFLLYW